MPCAAAIAVRLQLWSRHGATPQPSELAVISPPGQSVLQTDLGRKAKHLRIDFKPSQNKILSIQLNAPFDSGLSRLNDAGWIPVL
jgi:hypothetical protein